jgi:microcystin degradation protein MlrC
MAPRVGLVALVAPVDSFASLPAKPAEILTGPRLDRTIDSVERGIFELSAFATAMGATGPWQRVPIAGLMAAPSGLRDMTEIAQFRDALSQAIEDARPLDAVVVALGGPMATKDDDDLAGTLLASLRTSVGPGVAILALARSTTQLSDVAFRSVDLVLPAATATDGGATDNGRRLALLLRLMLADALRPSVHHVRLPLLWARTGTALARLHDVSAVLAHQAAAAGLLAAGVAGGAPWFDSRVQGLTVIGVGTERDAVRRFTLDAAAHVWQRRSDGIGTLVTIPDAVTAALDGSRSPMLFVDSGDRIDLGGSGHGTDLLAAFAWSGVPDVLAVGHVDPGVFETVRRAGVGATVFATFNRAAAGDLFEVEAEVVGLDDARSAAALAFGGIKTIVSSVAIAAGHVPDLLDRLGVSVPRCMIAKFVPPSIDFGDGAIWPTERIDVQTAGTTDPTVEGRSYTRIPRPLFPVDQEVAWPPADDDGVSEDN